MINVYKCLCACGEGGGGKEFEVQEVIGRVWTERDPKRGSWVARNVPYLLEHVLCCVQWCPILWDPWQTPLSMGFSRREYGSPLLFPSPGFFPSPGIEPASLVSPELAGRFFTTEPLGKPMHIFKNSLSCTHKICTLMYGNDYITL